MLAQKNTEEVLELLSTTLSHFCDMFSTTTIVWSIAFLGKIKAMNEIRGLMNREAIELVSSRGGHYS